MCRCRLGVSSTPVHPDESVAITAAKAGQLPVSASGPMRTSSDSGMRCQGRPPERG